MSHFEPQANKRPAWKKFAWPAAATLALFVGIGIGSSGSNATTTASQPAPTVTKTVTKTKTDTQTVEKTPKSCSKALDIAQEAMGAVAQEHEEIANAAQSGDVNTFVEGATKAVQKVGKKIEDLTPEMQVQASDCRAKE